MSTIYTYFCDHCGAVIELAPTNSNAGLNVVCRGQQQVVTSTNGQEDPVQGNHEYTEMRQIGAKPL